MFETSGQFYYFSECLFIGVILGLTYEAFNFIEYIIDKKTLTVIIDFAFSMLSFSVYFYASYYFGFPPFRA